MRKLALVTATLSLIAASIGGTALAQTGGGEEYTGCLTPGGLITRVAEGNEPSKPCGAKAEPITLAGSAAIAAQQAEIDDLTGRVEAVETQLEALPAEVADLADRVGTLETLLAGVERVGTRLDLPGGLKTEGNILATQDMFLDGTLVVLGQGRIDGRLTLGADLTAFLGVVTADSVSTTSSLVTSGYMSASDSISTQGPVTAGGGVFVATSRYFSSDGDLYAGNVYAVNDVIADSDIDGNGDLKDWSPVP